LPKLCSKFNISQSQFLELKLKFFLNSAFKFLSKKIISKKSLFYSKPLKFKKIIAKQTIELKND
jgi:hypothetical protein